MRVRSDIVVGVFLLLRGIYVWLDHIDVFWSPLNMSMAFLLKKTVEGICEW